MKKTLNNYRVRYGDAIRSLGSNDEEFESLKDINAELEAQIERERNSASEFPEFYKLSDIMSSYGGNGYRSGDACGAKVMTYEDYLRLIVAETHIPEYGKHKRESYHVEPRPATVYTVRECGRSLADSDVYSSVESVIDGDGYSVTRVESSDTTVYGSFKRTLTEWAPLHKVKRPERKYRRRLASSAAGIAWVMIFAIVLALPVTLAVLKSEALSNLNDKKAELAVLESEAERLEAEFESGLDLREIEKIAINDYGMIKLNESTIKVLRLNDMDSIESFQSSKRSAIVPALLSALGIRNSGE
jgi:cell division protein FtsB